MHVAAQLVPSTEVIALVAGIGHFRPKHAFFQADEPVHQLEHRSRRIRSLHRAVVHGLIGVGGNLVPILADIGQHVHIDTRGRYQRQDFAGFRLNGHDTAHLVLHELLPELLEVGVDGGDDILPGDGFLVFQSVLVRLLNLVTGIAQVDVVTLFPAQLLFPRGLDARHARIVSAAVFSRVAVDIGLVYLRHVAQQVAAGVHGIIPDAAHLSPEARELVFHFVEAHVSLGRDRTHHGDGLEADGGAPTPIVLQFFPDEIRVHFQDGGQRQGVEFLHFPRAHHDVVGHLVAHQDAPVAVINDATGGVDGFVDGGVAVGVFLIGIVQDLQGKNFAQENQHGYSQANDQPDMAAVFGHRRGSGARRPRVSRETSMPATRETAKRRASNDSGRIPALSIHT